MNKQPTGACSHSPLLPMLGLSLAVHLLGLLIWHSLQAQPVPLTLPVADISIHLQYNQPRTVTETSRPVSKPLTTTVSTPVPVPVPIKTKPAKNHAARQTIIKATKAERLKTAKTGRTKKTPITASPPAPTAKHESVKKPSASRISLSHVISRLQEDLKQYFYYPRLAQRKNIQGAVILGFAISRQGKINHIRIVKSSGFAILDFAAEDALRKLNQLHWEQNYLQRNNQQIELPVIYHLTES